VPSAGQANSHARQTSVNSTSRFSFASSVPSTKQNSIDTTGSFDFLPPVNFDDLQASLTKGEADTKSFPVSGVGRRVLSGNNDDGDNDYVRLKSSPRKSVAVGVGFTLGQESPLRRQDSAARQINLSIGHAASMGPSAAGAGSTLGQESPLRRQNSAARHINSSIGHPASTGPSAAAVNTKTRRQSYFPVPNGNLSIQRQPRKSVGPGVLPSEFSGSTVPKRIIGQGHLDSDDSDRPARMEMDADGSVFGIPLGAHSSETSSIGMARGLRAKSLLPPPRFGSDQLLTPSGSPDPTMPLLIGSARSPARPLPQSSGTPSSDKRLSMMPNSVHATGLAARTISPTDARRLKRMSMMPTPPGVPSTPHTPQPDTPTTVTRNMAPSPPIFPRKSITPSSSRTTPDHNRKSYSSGISNSSSTSYSSFGNSTSSARMSQSLSTSRLPTLKTRIESTPAASGEEVPPVPAIPKAYESPKTEFDQPFFFARKSSLPFDTSSTNSGLTTEGALSGQGEREVSMPDSGRQRRGLILNECPGAEKKASGAININRRTLQPLRMPPLNLLPLSTPTAAKIAALYDGASAMSLGSTTPPPKKGQRASPGTPMTASKATFSRSFRDEVPVPQMPQLRSNSSHHTVRPDSSAYRVPSSSSSHIPIASERNEAHSTRKAISPFVSSSLPKTSGDFGYTRQASGASFDKIGSTGVRPSKLTGPRLQRPRENSRDDASSVEASSPADATGSSFRTSLRRKLSLTRKRSLSKAQSRADNHTDFEAPPKPPKHDIMPPPKLPASATWNGPLMPSPSPTHKQSTFQSREKSSKTIINSDFERMRSNTWTMNGVPKKEDSPVTVAATPNLRRTLRAQLEGGPSQNSLSLKDFLNEAKESPLDRDDLSAEDEMRRLASKRKETEIAAKELDALGRRATAKERVSPSRALRMANLNIFERGEIIDYKDVFFCGTQDANKHIGDLTSDAVNFGYDDERGDYNIVAGDHLAYRYEIIDILGKGSFGQVARCIDHKTGTLMAIKIIRNKKRFHQQALVEVDILQKLRDWVSLSTKWLPESLADLLRILAINTAW